MRKDEKKEAIHKINHLIDELFIDLDIDESDINNLIKNCLKEYKFED